MMGNIVFVARVLSVIAMLFFFAALWPKNSWAEKKFSVLALGDSTTAGTPGFFSPAEKPPQGDGDVRSQYAYWILQKHPAWTVWNRGVRGWRSDQILKRFQREVVTYNPDVVVVLAGVNDLHQGFSAEHVESNLRKIYDVALAKKAVILACTILPYNESTALVKQEMARVNEWIRALSQERGFLFCDTYAALNDPANPGNLIGTPDGIHPDIEGYRKMGEAIEVVLATSPPSAV